MSLLDALLRGKVLAYHWCAREELACCAGAALLAFGIVLLCEDTVFDAAHAWFMRRQLPRVQVHADRSLI